MKLYLGKPYSPREVRELFFAETPEAFTAHRIGRRTMQGEVSDRAEQGNDPHPSHVILQPEWTGAFYRIMGDNDELRKSSNWWFFPVRRALAKIEPREEWGGRRRTRRQLVQRAMILYLYSNYNVPQIAQVLDVKRHEAYRLLEDAAAAMTPYIGLFGEKFREFDPTTFASGLNR